MANLRLYYYLKPYLPWRLRMAMRRLIARRKLEAVKKVWPINPAAERKPEGWKGWPSGHRFAFVITHDVEGQHGFDQVRKLAEVEKSLGFRSSFNFIPEGEYQVTAEMRAWLGNNGFEVGVHDLHHDGKLYTNSDTFSRNAVKINRYLREWGASGFRSGFMLRNLDWLHRLDIQYESSTFDTDPFEPQPDGTGTIYPYWVTTPCSEVPFKTAGAGQGRASVTTAGARGGYVEIPYTLPQDSTLFLVLRHSTPEVWMRKLDWIVENGGMALVNVHPDYIEFGDKNMPVKKFPVEIYADFLRYVSEKYAGQYWQPLARDLSRWYAEKHVALPARAEGSDEAPAPSGRLKGKRVAVLLYSHYPSDPRPRRAAEAMVQQGMSVEVICLKSDPDDASDDVVNGVAIHRLPFTHSRGGKLLYVWNYARFIATSFLLLTRRSFGKRYDLVHVHNMPDVLVFSALTAKMMGAKVLLDLHDPMPELMTTIFDIKPSSLSVRLLRFLERCSIGFSDAAVTVNETCKNIFSARSCSPAKMHVVMNSPDERIFKYREPDPAEAGARPADRPFVMMYHGALVERHGLDIAVEALAAVLPKIPHAELRVYGRETPFLRQVLDSITDPAVKAAVKYLGGRTIPEICTAILECDVGVIPNKSSVFTKLNTPTRLFEYISLGKPVIAPRSLGITDYFGPQDLVYFELGDAADLARQMEFVYREPAAVAKIVRNGQDVYLHHQWSNERIRLLRIADSLVGDPAPGAKEV